MSRRARRLSSRLGNIGAVGATGIHSKSPAQVSTLVCALARGLLWGRPAAARELGAWFQRAAAIPDPAIREDALDSLVRKRDNVEGASLFSILPRRRDERLLILLVAYQVMWDFLDSVSERGASAGHANGRQLHRALVEALDPEAPISDYYRYHPWKNDGGYLLALVQVCRRTCLELPSYRLVRPLMLHGVERCAIQYLNHEPESRRREQALREWAEREVGRRARARLVRADGGRGRVHAACSARAGSRDLLRAARSARRPFGLLPVDFARDHDARQLCRSGARCRQRESQLHLPLRE